VWRKLMWWNRVTLCVQVDPRLSQREPRQAEGLSASVSRGEQWWTTAAVSAPEQSNAERSKDRTQALKEMHPRRNGDARRRLDAGRLGG
jgi:hypothetical protein